jgi:hypothetical protein
VGSAWTAAVAEGAAADAAAAAKERPVEVIVVVVLVISAFKPGRWSGPSHFFAKAG